MLTPLTEAPRHISPEEHATLTSSTPASFQDIPPVLRWKSEDAEVVLDPAHPFWSGPKKGTLWVTEDAVSFLPAGAAAAGEAGFSLPFPSLSLHALSPASAETGGSAAHIYCQIDESDAPAPTSAGQNGNGNGAAQDDEGEGEEDEYTAMREMRIYVPQEQLEGLFAALSSCSALHDSLLPSGEPSSFGFFPAHDDIDDEDEDDGGWEEDAEGQEDGGDGGPGRVDPAVDPVDQVSRFRDMIDWGNVPKPPGWDNDDDEEDVYADAPRPEADASAGKAAGAGGATASEE